MKFSTLVVALAVAAASAEAVDSSVECSQAQLDAIDNSKWRDACKSTSLGISRYRIDNLLISADPDTLKRLCGEKDCLKAVAETMRKYPACSVAGASLSTTAQTSYTNFQLSCSTIGMATAGYSGAASAPTAGLLTATGALAVAAAMAIHV